MLAAELSGVFVEESTVQEAGVAGHSAEGGINYVEDTVLFTKLGAETGDGSGGKRWSWISSFQHREWEGMEDQTRWML